MNFWQRWATHRIVAHARARVVAQASTATIIGASLLSDTLNDTDYVARNYCPGCQPDKDPTQELLNVTWCSTHAPGLEGSEDKRATTSGYLSGSAEAGGPENAAWCARIHRGVTVPVAASSEVGAGAPVEYFGCG